MRHRVAVVCASLAVAFAVYAAESDTFTPAQRGFWSLVAVKRQAVPFIVGQAEGWLRRRVSGPAP